MYVRLLRDKDPEMPEDLDTKLTQIELKQTLPLDGTKHHLPMLTAEEQADQWTETFETY